MNARDRFLAEFERVAAALPGHGSARMRHTRREALQAFAASGLPTPRDEDWRYTSLAALDGMEYAVVPRPPRTALSLGQVAAWRLLRDSHLLVFVDGRYEPRLSRPGRLPRGVVLASLAEMLEGRQRGDAEALLAVSPATAGTPSLWRLNTAFAADGLYVRLAPGAALDAPVEVLSVATQPGLAVHLRHLVRAGEGSCAAIVEHYIGTAAAAYVTNTATDIVAGPGALIEHHRVQDEGRQAIHIATVAAEQQAGSGFTSNVFAFGGALARADVGATLRGENAHCALNGLYLAGGRQHTDHRTAIDHAAAGGTSRELYKGIADGAARAVFNGKVIVRPGARQTDAQQINRNLLLSENAEIDTRPQLEIFADDVKCSHGATVGQLDAEQLFYLRSRGVDSVRARGLLVQAFVREMIDRVGIPALRTELGRRLIRELDMRTGQAP